MISLQSENITHYGKSWFKVSKKGFLAQAETGVGSYSFV